jgi:hypothetical protein
LTADAVKSSGRRSVFSELSRSLSDAERNELLHSINTSLRMTAAENSEDEENTIDEDEIKLRIDQEIKRATLFDRFLLWIRKLLMGKSYQSLMLEMKLEKLKKGIKRQNQNLTGFETRDLKPGFAREVWPVYEASLMLYRWHDELFGKKAAFKDLMIILFRNRLEGTISEPKEIFPVEEMIEIYRKEGTDESVRKMGNKLLEEELEKVVNPSIVAELEKITAPLIAADRLVRFPYKRLFSGFGLVGIEAFDIYESTGSIPTFKSATAVTMLDVLEQLFKAVFQMVSLREKGTFEEEVALELLCLCNKREVTEKEVEEYLYHYHHLLESVESFYKSVPLVELIRYFRKNPYYRIKIVQERMNLKAFFRTARKILMREYVETELPEVREAATDRIIGELFTEGEIEQLKNYRTYQSISYDELSLPMFSYQQSLSLVYSFCKKKYKTEVLETVRILDRGLYALNRVERDRLLMHANALEDVEDEIEKLDYSLSAEENDGKLFQRLRFSLGGDQGQLRLFRSLVHQKDNEASIILRRGREAVDGLIRIFEDTLKIRSESGVRALEQHYFMKGFPVSLRSLIEKNIAVLKRFSFIMQQIKRREP